jgi:hypothetical protein
LRGEANQPRARRRPALLRVTLPALLLALGVTASFAPAARASSSVPTALPPATYPKTYSEQQWITMDDGIKLAATLTFPSNTGAAPASGRFPVVLAMTPYGREGVCSCGSPTDFATRGFVSAVVDVRGTGGSQGNLDGNYFSPREAKDGYDLVEYLGTRSWSTGKVGMTGGSYVGITQYKTAETDPPHLAAIAPDVALANIYNDAFAPGGIMSLSFDTQYLGVQGGPGLLTPNTDPSMIPGTLTAKDQQATGAPIAFAYLENPYDDQFYIQRSPITRVSRIHVPVFVEDGWRDAFEAGDLQMFQALESRRRVPTYVNVGPCTHKGCGAEGESPTDNPPGVDNVEAQEIRFDQRYLMGKKVPALPRVRLYDQQADHYLDASSWPPARTGFAREYLGAGTIAPRTQARSQESYFTNPAAGYSMTFDEQGTVAISPYVPTDQRLEDGQGLTWRTSVLNRSLTLGGPIALRLVAASTATNTDWVAKLSDVAPDGTESIVAEGQLRASLRALARGSTAREPLQTLSTPQPIAPGRFYDYEIAIAPTAYEFKPGHRLQLRLTSSNVPNSAPGTVDLNPTVPVTSTFVPLSPATNTVRLGGAGGTSLLLPVYGNTASIGGGRTGCPSAGGRLSGSRLGAVRLGMSRRQAQRAFTRSSTRGHRYMEFFCLSPSGVRVGYASPKLHRGLSTREWRRARGRVVIVLTADRHYALRGVRPGVRVAAVKRRLHLGRPFHVGLNFWYLTPSRRVHGVLKVRHGRVQEIGIANGRLTRTRSSTARFLRTFL